MRERFGDYELLHKIATGGMAEIYLAKVLAGAKAGELLVVKRMLPELAVREDFVTMFLDEARLAANFDHENVVKVFNLGEVAKSYFMAMELIDGPHLGALFAHSLRLRKPLPTELCVYACARAAEGLDYAHDLKDAHTGRALKIVHRDISPQNILVSRDGTVKVTDFGVAKATTQEAKTRTGIIKGKVSYMSPEQCLGEKVDRRTDVFALGIVLYELLTRRRLFRDRSDLLVMQRITNKDVAPPSTMNPSLDQDLDTICLRALARNRRKRYSKSSELASALDLWLEVNGHYRCKERLSAWLVENAPHLCLTETIAGALEPTNTDDIPQITGRSAEDLDATVVANAAAYRPNPSDDDATVISPKPDFLKDPFQPVDTETVPFAGPQTVRETNKAPLALPTEKSQDSADTNVERAGPASVSDTDPDRGPPPGPALPVPESTRTGSYPGQKGAASRAPPREFSTSDAESASLPSIVTQSTSAPPWGAIAGALVVIALVGAGAWAILSPPPQKDKPVTVALGDPKAAASVDAGTGDLDGGAGTAIVATPGPDDDDAGAIAVVDAPPTGGVDEPPPEKIPPQDLVKLRVKTVPSSVPIFLGERFLGNSPVDTEVEKADGGEVVARFDNGAITRKVALLSGNVDVDIHGRVELKLTSTPSDASVVLNGGQYSNFESKTPIDGEVLLEPGVEYRVELNKDGYQSTSFTLLPTAGKPTKKSARLKKAKGQTSTKKVTQKRPDRPPRDVDTRAAKGSGTLRLFSSVPVQVKVGGKAYMSPVRDEKLPAGSQLIVVTNPDLGITSRFRVNIPKNNRATVKLFFDQKGGKYVLSRKVIE